MHDAMRYIWQQQLTGTTTLIHFGVKWLLLIILSSSSISSATSTTTSAGTTSVIITFTITIETVLSTFAPAKREAILLVSKQNELDGVKLAIVQQAFMMSSVCRY
jgi:hypothetical protein